MPQARDRNGTLLHERDSVRFYSYRGTVMNAVVEHHQQVGVMVSVRIGKDPFPTYVDRNQLESTRKDHRMPTTEPLTRELRQKARDQGVKDWEILDREGLLEAVDLGEPPDDDEDIEEQEEEPVPTKRTSTKKPRKAPAAKKAPAKKAAAKKAPAKKVAAKKKATTTTKRAAPRPVANDGPNPFTPGTKLNLITEALMKGGKRSDLVKQLRGKLEYHPRSRGGTDFDPDVETDRRLKIVGYLLRQQHGFTYEHTGKGPDAYIKVTPPAKRVRK